MPKKASPPYWHHGRLALVGTQLARRLARLLPPTTAARPLGGLSINGFASTCSPRVYRRLHSIEGHCRVNNFVLCIV